MGLLLLLVLLNNMGKTVECKGNTYELADDKAFDDFRNECLKDGNDWKLAYEDAASETKVWSKKGETSAINICKVRTVYKDLDPAVLYDILHDHQYRKVWDQNMIEGIVIDQLDPVNEVGYYSCKIHSMVSNRDFVNQRCWRRDTERGEYIIFNHSVPHSEFPEKKGFVRAQSILSGYFIQPNEGGGSIFTYLTQSDPKGWIPSWLLNWLMTKLGPNLLKKLYDAAKEYNAWKQKQDDPNH